jgi:hypothetical protein
LLRSDICGSISEQSDVAEKEAMMSTQRIQETMGGSSKLLLLVLRHIVVAPLVSLVVSFASLLPGVFLIAILGQHLGRALCFTFVGFCGVFSGARCLPQISRRFGSIGLTLLGLIYYSNFIAHWGEEMTDEGKMINMHDRSLVEVILLAFGGLLATTVIWWSSSRLLQPIRGDCLNSATRLEPHG